jgi:hypothetical protein
LAYAAVVTWDVERYPLSGGKEGFAVYTIKVVETDAAAGSEWNTVHTAGTNTVTNGTSGITGSLNIPKRGTVLCVQATLISGSGATIDPVAGKAAGFTTSGQNLIFANGTAAANVYEISPARYTYDPGVTSSRLYGRSTVSAGADNVIHTLIVIVEGMHI